MAAQVEYGFAAPEVHAAALAPYRSNPPAFEGTLLAWCPATARTGAERMPAPGSAVTLRFGPDGFAVEHNGERCGAVVLLPSAFLEPASPAQDGEKDPTVVQIEGAWPVWSVALRFESEGCAGRFAAQVLKTSVSLVAWMHSETRADLNRGAPMAQPSPGIAEGTTHAPLVAAGYAITAALTHQQQWGHRPGGPLAPRCALSWLELRASPKEGGSVELVIYNREGEGAHEIDTLQIGSGGSQATCELAGSALVFRGGFPRDAHTSGPVTRARSTEAAPAGHVAAFRSEVEAAAWADLVKGALTGDAKLLQGARARLQRCLEQLECPPAGRPAAEHERPCCFVRADAELGGVGGGSPLVTDMQRMDDRTSFWGRRQERERRAVEAAVRACQEAGPPEGLVSSDTVVIS